MPTDDSGQYSAVSVVVRDLDPGAFAFVMATGIVSVALLADGATVPSVVLFVVGLIGYVLLLAGYGWRLLRWRDRFAEDFAGPRAFALLTFVAASNVLSSRLSVAGYELPATILLAVGMLAWLGLGYGVPLRLITSSKLTRGLEEVSGVWFLWVVATQSVAVASASLAPHSDIGALPVIAAVCWAVGLVLYPIIATLMLARLLLRKVEPAQLAPAYWVFMGAGAITVLAAARLLQLPPTDVLSPVVVKSLAVVQWSFCTWLIPLLLGLGVWRHAIRKYPLRYETGLWGLVFPIGMYGVASHQLGSAIDVPWLARFGGDEGWVAAAVWLVVFLAMLAARRRVSRSSRTA